MHRASLAILIAISLPLTGQVAQRVRPARPSMTADAAEAAVKQAIEQLGAIRKLCERDIAVLQHLRAADAALADPMQPLNAMQKAYEEVEAAKGLGPEFYVMQGVIRADREIDGARQSPATADFGRLRSILRNEAIGPASRVAVRDAVTLQDESLAWLRVQQLIADHLRTISEISSGVLRASEQ